MRCPSFSLGGLYHPTCLEIGFKKRNPARRAKAGCNRAAEIDADPSPIGAHRRRADFIDYGAAERLSGGSSARRRGTRDGSRSYGVVSGFTFDEGTPDHPKLVVMSAFGSKADMKWC